MKMNFKKTTTRKSCQVSLAHVSQLADKNMHMNASDSKTSIYSMYSKTHLLVDCDMRTGSLRE